MQNVFEISTFASQKKTILTTINLIIRCYYVVNLYNKFKAINNYCLNLICKQVKRHYQLNIFLMKKNLLISITISALLFTSCISQKKVAYFKDIDATSAESINEEFTSQHEPVLGNGDVLLITVSGLDPLAVAPFNLPLIMYSSPGIDKIYSSPTLQTFTIEIDGTINFPVIGVVKLAGLKKVEAVSLIKSKLLPYLKDPIVKIEFMNFQVTVLGEVNRPGRYSVTDEKISLLDALGMAGDITIYGRRENILITREINGKLEFKRINLNSDELFKSPYYYLKQNDVIYIEPSSVKTTASQNIPLYLSTLSTIAAISTSVMFILK